MPASLTCPNGHPILSTDAVCPLCGTLPHPEPVPLPTDPVLPAVPGYEVLGVLGQGGMGVVYRGRHVRLNRAVALKMIRDSGFASPDGVNRFRAEAEAVARLQHPNIVQIYEVGEHAGRPYCALEFVDGGSLADRLAHTPQPALYAAAVVQALARAVHHAHEQGIVHRDLKPANVLLTRQGTPKVTDFGLVKRLDDDSGQTATGAILGTPSYMAPEQTAGRTRDIGPRVDVYALGAILYEMLTGRPPFSGSSAFDTLEQVRNREPVPPRQLNPAAPRDLERAPGGSCLKCLQKDPAGRYGNGDELANDLRRFLGGEPIAARRVSVVERGWKWARRRPVPAVLAVGLLLATAALLAGWIAFTVRLDEARRQAEGAAAKELRHATQEQELRKEADAKRQAALAAAEAEKAAREAEAAQRKKAETVVKLLESVFKGLEPGPEPKAGSFKEQVVAQLDALAASWTRTRSTSSSRCSRPSCAPPWGRSSCSSASRARPWYCWSNRWRSDASAYPPTMRICCRPWHPWPWRTAPPGSMPRACRWPRRSWPQRKPSTVPTTATPWSP
jgi:serine/threonine-protein kinase